MRVKSIGEEEEMQVDARDALQEALAAEELYIENVMGELFVGNPAGLSYANYKMDQAALLARVDAQDIKIASLEDSVSGLKSSLGAYKILRNRFISTFKRDKLGTTTEADRRIISDGNEWAHGGDAAVDALLYEGVGGRRDTGTFEKLYGMPHGDVRMISHRPTIDVLNKHAKTISSKHEVGSDEFYKRFAKFIELFKHSDYDEGYLEGNPTDVTRAYWSFLSCIRKEVTRAEASD